MRIGEAIDVVAMGFTGIDNRVTGKDVIKIKTK
jgi:hypothetical protein